MFTASTKLILAAAALAVAFGAADANAKQYTLPKGPISQPKQPVVPKNAKIVLPKGPIQVLPKKPPIIVLPKFPKKPPIIVTPKFPVKPPVIIVNPVYPKVISPVVVEQQIIRPVAVAKPAVSINNCLTKEYTPEGQVLFKDLCTNEMAMGPAAGAEPQTLTEAQPSVNYAGKTYQDYLAANGAQSQN